MHVALRFDEAVEAFRLFAHEEVADVLPLPRLLDETIDVLWLFGEKTHRVQAFELEPCQNERVNRLRFLVAERNQQPDRTVRHLHRSEDVRQ